MADHCPAVGISTEQYSSQSKNLEIKRLNDKGWWRTLSRQEKRRQTTLTVYKISFPTDRYTSLFNGSV